jgi:hypothetical protein
MTPAQAKRYVLVGTIGAGGLSAIAAFRRGGIPSTRIAIGTVAAGVLLSIAAEVVPDLAGAFALLLLVTAAFVLGGDAWTGISAATAPTPPT